MLDSVYTGHAPFGTAYWSAQPVDNVIQRGVTSARFTNWVTDFVKGTVFHVFTTVLSSVVQRMSSYVTYDYIGEELANFGRGLRQRFKHAI